MPAALVGQKQQYEAHMISHGADVHHESIEAVPEVDEPQEALAFEDPLLNEDNCSRNVVATETTKPDHKTMQEAERRRHIGAPSTDTDAVHPEVLAEKYWSVSDVVSHSKAPSSSTDQLQAALASQE